MTSRATAIVLGGSGSVGIALIRELLHDDGFGAIIALLRRSLPDSVAGRHTAGGKLVSTSFPTCSRSRSPRRR